ncbi:MAG: TIR domain-containing protein [Anaerolineaceae bacterium]|nr:TIR domain-containing protein [Anaerolineaceae bacterium]
MTSVFINYRRQDSEGYVGRLYDHLLRHFAPQDIFMDVASIEPGQDFVQALDNAVAACDAFVAVIGPQWATVQNEHGERRLDQWNDFVRIEIASAIKQGKLIVPVLVGRARMPAPLDLPEDITALSRRNALELSHGNFASDMERLIAVLKDAAPTKQSFKRGSDSKTYQRKAESLKAVRDDLVNATTSPLYTVRVEGRYFPVLGEGDPDANIMFIGESPGKHEAQQGKPFCGPSGDILDELLRGIGLARESVYITNILLDHPGAKREPTPQELAFYTPFADRIVDIIQPAVIVTLGRFAMQYMLKKLDLPEKRGTITQLHGKLIKARLHYGEIHIVPMYHPAVVLYSASQKDTLKQDFEKLKLFV